MSRFVALFDASPTVDPTAWMKKCCTSTGLFLADINQISKLMGEDPKAQPALLKTTYGTEDPALAPYYSAALEKLAGKHERIAVHSVSWFIFGQKPSVCVLDYDNLELERAKGKSVGVTDSQYDALVAKARAKIDERVKQYMAPDRVLVLPKQGSDASKAEASAAFIKKWEGK